VTVRTFWILGCLFALAAVGAGAFGAHGLRGRVSAEHLAVFETAVRYQLYHALALLALALAAARAPARGWAAAGWLFAAGVLVFSGSLYLLVLTGVRWWGAVTPVGGVAFLAGWVVAAAAGARALREPRNPGGPAVSS
jgi:uncharacterized membrane protein YgdD (TMEM256/DUF423 family)